MDENPGASESDASPSDPSDPSGPAPHPSHGPGRDPHRAFLRVACPPRRPFNSVWSAIALALLVALACNALGLCPRACADGLEQVRASGALRYGCDMEGGGPYAYPDPGSPREVTGFEVELMALVGKELGAKPEFSQGQWDKLLQILDSGRLDAVINGYEWTENRALDYAATRPYYIYQLQLMVPRQSPLRSWDDLKRPRDNSRKWTVGVLVGSAADTFAADQGGPNVQVVRFDGATDAMTAVQNGQYDATLQDLPAAIFYRDRFPGLELAGAPVSRGYYVIYTRNEDRSLRDAIDQVLGRLVATGELRRLYEKYRIWTEAQHDLSQFNGPLEVPAGRQARRGLGLLRQYWSRLLDAAVVTIALSLGSFPLAIGLGLLVAVGRLYGPAPLRTVLTGYVELIRGTPLMLQLFVLFYLLKLPPWVAGIGGLAINYSAYEAEIYRAGLQAIPRGQMEAALALGMSRGLALRRVIIPQAVRIVIPPVTNDFIALFKDTSVCSVITLVELTKQYSILANSTGGAIEFALAAAVLYLLMSVPLSWFSRWSEQRMAGGAGKGGS